MYVPELCVRAVKSLATLCVYAGSYEPSLFSTKLSWTSPFQSFTIQPTAVIYLHSVVTIVTLEQKRLAMFFTVTRYK